VKRGVVAFVSGVVFAVGLAISGMTKPSKVIDFLDFTGSWDPSLAFVMVGAIGVHVYFARHALGMRAPLLADRFDLSTKRGLDARLVGGAALFGVGWGLGGYCPGPAFVSLASGATSAFVFVGAMLAGLFIARRAPEAATRVSFQERPLPLR
jgi:uncharacterized membrane protein YedE/YeeE